MKTCIIHDKVRPANSLNIYFYIVKSYQLKIINTDFFYTYIPYDDKSNPSWYCFFFLLFNTPKMTFLSQID